MYKLARRIDQEDRGLAMVTAVLVTAIVLSLGAVAVELSVHNSSSSSLDRKRTQAIDASEAGLDSFFSQLTTTPSASMPCPAVAGNPNDRNSATVRTVTEITGRNTEYGYPSNICTTIPDY